MADVQILDLTLKAALDGGELIEIQESAGGPGSSKRTPLGNSASKTVGTAAGTVAAGDHAHAGVYDPAGTAAAGDSAHTGAFVHADIALNTAARHSHSNKSTLDTYTQSNADLADAVSKKHSHTSTNAFGTIVVSGGSNVVADSENDTLTIAAGTNVQVTTEAGSDTVTIGAAHNHDSSYQPLDATLTAVAGLTTGADVLPYFTAADTASTTTLTSFARSLLDDGDAATARTTLGVTSSSNAFGTIVVAGQSNVVADASPDTLTLVAGTNVQVTTDAGADTVTINAAHNHDSAYQPLDATLTAVAGLTTAADALPYFTGTDTASTTTLTSFARTVLDDTTAANARSTLGAAASSHAHLFADVAGVQGLHGVPLNASGGYDLTVTYSSVNRQITLTPTGASFDVFIKGLKYTFTGAQVSTAHANLTGTYYYYINESGVLTLSGSGWNLELHAPIAYVYYNATLSEGIPFFELHRADRDIWAHIHAHENIGCYVVSGLTIADYTIQTDTTAGVTYSIASGVVADEDIRRSIGGISDGGPYTIIRRTGSGTDWTWTTANTLPYLVGTNNPQYNQFTGGSWGLTELSNGQYVNYYVFATTAVSSTYQIFLVPGQAVHASLVAAQAESVGSIQWGTMPFQEIAPLYQITIRCQTAYSDTTYNARLEAITRIIGTRIVVTMSSQAGDMRQAVYDTDGDGVVDSAETVVGADLTTSAADGDILVRQSGTWSRMPHSATFTPSAGTVTVNFSQTAKTAKVPLSAATTITLSGGTPGIVYLLSLEQDATGSRTVTMGSELKFGTDITAMPTLTTTASKTDHFAIKCVTAGSVYRLLAYSRGY